MTTTPKQLQLLKSLSNRKDVAEILKVTPTTLTYHLYVCGTSEDTKNVDKYTEFKIPKKTGGTRIISVPNKGLKIIQSRLSKILYDVSDEINKEKNHNGRLSHGYKKHSSIFSNAIIHEKKRYVFNIDLKDFFNAINFGRVRGFFIKDRNFELNEDVATTIAQVACHKNSLPQGSPCSPIISNLIGHILDINLSKLASRNGCSYSRYCDDITFSTNKKVFPHEIAFSHDGEIYEPSKKLSKIILRSGFEINLKKVRMSHFYSQQNVTGLTVNKKVNTPRVYRDTVRALVHSLCSKGSFEFKGSFKKDKINESKKMDSLQGMLNYISRIEYDYKKSKGTTQYKNKYPNQYELTKNESVLKDYILYRYFFNPDEVTIFGEGKTDKTHFKHYLNFRESHPLHTPANLYRWKLFRLHNFESNLFDVISRSGGTSDISKLMNDYGYLCKKFHKKVDRKPIILLLDNDEGARAKKGGIFSKIQTIKNLKTKPDGSEPFYHLHHNMYVVFLPRLNSQDTDIESFYPEDIKKIIVRGKSFNKSNRSSVESNHYGKKIFATEVVKNNADLVDWSVFDSIFDRIQLAVEDFEAKQY